MSLEAAIAVNRFGLGARPGEIEAVGADPRAWLADQIGTPRRISQWLRTEHPSPRAAYWYAKNGS